jgi:HEAT repeat protein
MYQQVLDWLQEAPFSDPDKIRLRPNFSYEAWFARGRSIPHITEALINLLEQEDTQHPSGNGMRVAYALGFLGNRGDKRAIKTLLASIQSTDITLRIEAVAALGRLGDERVLPVLENLLLDKNEDLNVRANACIAIGRLGIPSSQGILRNALSDSDPFIARCAEEALRLLGASAPPVSK